MFQIWHLNQDQPRSGVLVYLIALDSKKVGQAKLSLSADFAFLFILT